MIAESTCKLYTRCQRSRSPSRLAACVCVNTTVDDCWLIRLKALLKGSQPRISGKGQAFQAADAFQMCHERPVHIPEWTWICEADHEVIVSKRMRARYHIVILSAHNLTGEVDKARLDVRAMKPALSQGSTQNSIPTTPSPRLVPFLTAWPPVSSICTLFCEDPLRADR